MSKKLTSAQMRAQKQWDAKNKDRKAYLVLKNSAFRFLNPQKGSKSYEVIQANYDEYLSDLDKLRKLLEGDNNG